MDKDRNQGARPDGRTSFSAPKTNKADFSKPRNNANSSPEKRTGKATTATNKSQAGKANSASPRSGASSANHKKSESTASYKSREKICYQLLSQVFVEGGYSTISLDSALREIPPSDRPAITRLFYGVIEKSIQFDFIIGSLTEKPPKKSVAILLKIGLYLLLYSDMPDYAAINTAVNLSKEAGKSGVSGFINAFLHKAKGFELPKNNLSVMLSYPKWVTDRLTARYGEEFAAKMLVRVDTPHRHIRRNSRKITAAEFDKKMAGAEKTPLGYLADGEKLRALKPDEFTVQSLSSMLAVHAYLSGGQPKRVLDICAAPGGKSIYLSELCGAKIVCSDIHLHRVELVKKYAARMGASLDYACHDATVFNPEWAEKFDLVVCDVPCSGLGVKAKPDILLNRSEGDIAVLAALQLDILSAAARYVSVGGVLCYSTCTVFKEENEDVVERFLAKDFSSDSVSAEKAKYTTFSANLTDSDKLLSMQSAAKFCLEPIEDKLIKANNGMVNFYPAEYNSDGFFVARLRRKS